MVPDGLAGTHIPLPLRGLTWFALYSGYEGLYRLLTNQPDVVPRPLGAPKKLDALQVRSLGRNELPLVDSGVFLDDPTAYEERGLQSPMDCTVFRHAVLLTKPGTEATVWTMLPLPEYTLGQHASSKQAFLVLVESRTHDPMTLIAKKPLYVKNAVPDGTVARAEQHIATLLAPKHSDAERYTWNRGEVFFGVLCFQPELGDASCWKDRSPIIDVKLSDSGVVSIASPAALWAPSSFCHALHPFSGLVVLPVRVSIVTPAPRTAPLAQAAPAADILPVKVLNMNGSGSSGDVADGIKWAADHGATVINLSLGGDVESQTLRAAIDRATAAGIVVVADRGDDGCRQVPVFQQPGTDFGMVGAEVLAFRAVDAVGMGQGVVPGVLVVLTPEACQPKLPDVVQQAHHQLAVAVPRQTEVDRELFAADADGHAVAPEGGGVAVRQAAGDEAADGGEEQRFAHAADADQRCRREHVAHHR